MKYIKLFKNDAEYQAFRGGRGIILLQTYV